jgi:hypothetical protein
MMPCRAKSAMVTKSVDCAPKIEGRRGKEGRVRGCVPKPSPPIPCESCTQERRHESAIRFIEMFTSRVGSRVPVTVGSRRRLEFTARPISGEFEKRKLGNETLSTLLGRPRNTLVRTPPPMPPLPLAASCAHLFIPELVLKRRPRQLPDACASHWQCDPNDCGLPVLGTDASTEAAAAAAAATEATCARHRRHATVSSASLRSPRGGWVPVAPGGSASVS